MIIIKKIKHISSIPRKCAYFKGPILRGKDIKRNGYQFADLWLITTHNGYTNSDGETITRVKIEDYPTIKKYLDTYNTKVTNRSDQGDTPYNLRSCAYMDDFSKQKIIYPNMTSDISFVLDNNGYLTNQKCFIMTGTDIEYICEQLNKDYMKLYYTWVLAKLGSDGYELSKIFMQNIPIIRKDNYIDFTDDEIKFISSSVSQ